jgi:hypothetical protein
VGKLALVTDNVPGMSKEAIAKVRAFEKFALAVPQIGIPTEHLIHGGMYARTIYMPKDSLVTGTLIKISTVVLMHGHTCWYVGEDQPVFRKGYHVVPASPGRRQVVVAIDESYITMISAYDGDTLEGAERNFTDEYDLLGSHSDFQCNRLVITGEK